MNKRVQYMYMIFVTAMGKGYGCFAIQPVEGCPTKFNVTASYCHPNDRSKFCKTYARNKASRCFDPRPKAIARANELNEKLNVIVDMPPLEEDKRDYNTIDIVKIALANGLNIRSWAEQAMRRGLYYVTLEKDNLDWWDMLLDKKQHSRSLVVTMQNFYFNFGE